MEQGLDRDALGAEAVAIDVLKQDDPAFDHAGEDWAQVAPPLEIGIDENVMGQMQGMTHQRKRVVHGIVSTVPKIQLGFIEATGAPANQVAYRGQNL